MKEGDFIAVTHNVQKKKNLIHTVCPQVHNKTEFLYMWVNNQLVLTQTLN